MVADEEEIAIIKETPDKNLLDKSQNKPKKLPKWHNQQELILKKWSEIGSSYRYLHDKSFSKYNTQNLRFALPVIIISTITGTANFAQKSFPDAWAAYVPLGIGFLNLTAGLITTVAQFLRVSELLEGHRAASIAYSKFSRNISVELSLPIEQRTSDGYDFIVSCRLELDRLIEQSPNIPTAIVKLFANRFKNAEFFKPDILDIRPVAIYKNNVEMELHERNRIICEERNRRDIILHDEETRRAKLMTVMQNERAQQDADLLKKIERMKQDKRDTIGISTVEDNLDKLLTKLKNTNLPSIGTSFDSQSKLSVIINDLVNPISSKVAAHNTIEESLSISSDGDIPIINSTGTSKHHDEIILEIDENDITNNITDAPDNIINKSDNVVDTTDNITDTTDNIINKSDNVVDTTTTSGKSNDIVYGSIEEPVTLTEGEKALLKKQKIQNKFYYIDTVNKNVFNTKYSFVGTLMDNNTIKFK
jgi:hypothetical protein